MSAVRTGIVVCLMVVGVGGAVVFMSAALLSFGDPPVGDTTGTDDPVPATPTQPPHPAFPDPPVIRGPVVDVDAPPLIDPPIEPIELATDPPIEPAGSDWPAATTVADALAEEAIPRDTRPATIRLTLEFDGAMEPVQISLEQTYGPRSAHITIAPRDDRGDFSGSWELTDVGDATGQSGMLAVWHGSTDVDAETAMLQVTITCPPGQWWLRAVPELQRPIVRRFWVGPGDDVLFTSERYAPLPPERGDGPPTPTRVSASIRIHVKPDNDDPAAALEILQAIILPESARAQLPNRRSVTCFAGMQGSRHFWMYSTRGWGMHSWVSRRQEQYRACSQIAPVGDHPSAIDVYALPPGDWMLWLEIAGARHPVQGFPLRVPRSARVTEPTLDVEPGSTVSIGIADTGLPWELATRPFAWSHHRGMKPGQMEWEPLRRIRVHGVPDGRFVWQGWARVGRYCTILESAPVTINADETPPVITVPPPVWVTIRATVRWPNADEVASLDEWERSSYSRLEEGEGLPPLGLYQPEPARRSIHLPHTSGVAYAFSHRAQPRASDSRVTLALLSQEGQQLALDCMAPNDRRPISMSGDAIVRVPSPGPDGTAIVDAGDLRFEQHMRAVE